MAAPKGNKFAIGNSGKPRLFTSPQELEKEINRYFDQCDKDPIYKVEFNGKDATECRIPIQRPYTVEGLALHLDCDRKTLLNYQKTKGQEEYFPIITRAKQRITNQQISHGFVGTFNPGVLKMVLTNNTEYKDKAVVQHGLEEGAGEVGFTIKRRED